MEIYRHFQDRLQLNPYIIGSKEVLERTFFSLGLPPFQKLEVLFAAPGLVQSQIDDLIKVFRNEVVKYKERSLEDSDVIVALTLEQTGFNPEYLREILAMPEDLQPFESQTKATLQEFLAHPKNFAILRAASRCPPETDLSEANLNALDGSSSPFVRRYGAILLMKRAGELDTEGGHEAAIKAYEDCDERYGASEDPALQKHCAMALVNKGVTHGRMNDHEAAIKAYEDCDERYGASKDPALQKHCAMALFNKGITHGRMNDHEAEIKAYEDCDERYGASKDPALQKHCAMALVNKGYRLGLMNDHEAAIKAYEDCDERYGASEDPALQEQCAMALQNSVEMALLLGWRDKAVVRARQALERLGASDQRFAIMPFLIWVADPAKMTPAEVIAAIEALDAGAKGDWSFQEIAPLVADLPPERKRIAQAFIDHFEGRLDLLALKTALEA